MSEVAKNLIEEATKLYNQGYFYQAHISFAKAVLSDKTNAAYKAMFLESIHASGLNQFNSVLKQAILLCLDEPKLIHSRLFFPWYSLIKHDPAFGTIIQYLECVDYDDFINRFSLADFRTFFSESFVLNGLEKIFVKDHDFERLLTFLRRYFLFAENKENDRVFLKSLSIQCFLNEYLFYVSANEHKKIDNLKAQQQDLSTDQILILSCYEPLHSLEYASRFISKIDENLVEIQITQPQEELKLKSQIKSFGTLSDPVSKAVQEQYEEHPFPRWSSLGKNLRDPEQKNMSAGKSILVAGCGTGQQSVIVSNNFPLAQILAIDLSKTSLAYAQRKAIEFEVNNIEFLHGDILEVAKIGRSYDYIPCGGVLHHMNSPIEGLQALKSVLKPDGVMRLGLYSEIARRNIVLVQDWIKSKNIPSTSEGIRHFRKIFFEEDGYKDLFEQKPFFSSFTISECRDLFFHVQEHRFTCLQLKDIIDSLGFDLLLFAPEEHVLRAKYYGLFPDDPMALNLKNWHVFEQKFPNAFIKMYKFYIAHKGIYAPGDIPAWLR